MAEFVGIDPSETKEVEAFGETWLVGTVPALKYVALRDAWSTAYRPIAFASDEERDSVRRAQLEAVLTACSELVRWGVRGVKGQPPATERVKYGGVDVDVLPARVVDQMLRVSAGLLVDRLATAVISANDLDTKTLLGFR